MPKYLNYVTGDLCCTRQLVSKKPKQDKFPGTCVCKDILTLSIIAAKMGVASAWITGMLQGNKFILNEN